MEYVLLTWLAGIDGIIFKLMKDGEFGDSSRRKTNGDVLGHIRQKCRGGEGYEARPGEGQGSNRTAAGSSEISAASSKRAGMFGSEGGSAV